MFLEEPSDVVSCKPGDELFKGAMVATFNSTSYLDDLAWSALWLYRATKNETYLQGAIRYGSLVSLHLHAQAHAAAVRDKSRTLPLVHVAF